MGTTLKMRMYPKTPLRHSQPRVVRVARGRPEVPLSKQLGKFTGVNDDDRRLMWQDDERETSYYKDEEEDDNNTKDGGCFQGYRELGHPSTLSEVIDVLVENPTVLVGHEGSS